MGTLDFSFSTSCTCTLGNGYCSNRHDRYRDRYRVVPSGARQTHSVGAVSLCDEQRQPQREGGGYPSEPGRESPSGSNRNVNQIPLA